MLNRKYKRKERCVDAEQYFNGEHVPAGVCKCWMLIQPHIHNYLDGDIKIEVLHDGDWIVTEVIDSYIFHSVMGEERFKREYEEDN